MVNDGRPSRGCQMCRTRRIKCDETKPFCRRCVDSRRQCPGYKNELDLIFRNKTQETEIKAMKAFEKASERRRRKKPDPVKPGRHGSTPSASSSSPNTSIILATPKPAVEDQAACIFFQSFVFTPKQGSAHGFFKYLHPLMQAKSIPQHFRLAFDACALASLNNQLNTGNKFAKEATRLYAKALSATYSALRDPEIATQDTTLASILLFSVFESITATRVDNLAWGTHIEGAIQLVMSRGKRQLRTEIGECLFNSVRAAMVTHCLAAGKHPVMGFDWWTNHGSRDQPAYDCQRLTFITAEIKGDVNQLLTSTTWSPDLFEKISAMIERCRMHDQACADWEKNLPDYYRYKTVHWEDHVPDGDYSKADIYPGRVDAYQDLWVISVWTMLRCSRVSLINLSLRCSAWLFAGTDYRLLPGYPAAAEAYNTLITDMIAALPYQLGTPLRPKDGLADGNGSAFELGGEEVTRKGLGGWYATWSIACIYVLDSVTPSQRSWMQGRLRFIWSQLGVRFAQAIIQLNLRIPSMLILADGLNFSSAQQANGLERLVSTRNHLNDGYERGTEDGGLLQEV